MYRRSDVWQYKVKQLSKAPHLFALSDHASKVVVRSVQVCIVVLVVYISLPLLGNFFAHLYVSSIVILDDGVQMRESHFFALVMFRHTNSCPSSPVTISSDEGLVNDYEAQSAPGTPAPETT